MFFNTLTNRLKFALNADLYCVLSYKIILSLSLYKLFRAGAR